MEERDGSRTVPRVSRDACIDFISQWLTSQPSTLALIKYQAADQENQLGIMTHLGTAELVAFEQDGGLRDGHEYWRHSYNWTVHVRWYGLQHILLQLQRRYDDQNLRDILDYGTIVFDKIGIALPITKVARKSIVHKHVPSRQVYDYRIQLTTVLVTLEALFAMAGSVEPDRIAKLFEAYNTIMKIAERMTSRSELGARKEIAVSLSKAGRSRVDFTKAIGVLRDLVDRLLRKLGGPPRREFYAPVSAIYYMPPCEDENDRVQREQTAGLLREEFLCTGCGRLLASNGDNDIPILTQDAESAPPLERFTRCTQECPR